jgi:hypothetical protein
MDDVVIGFLLSMSEYLPQWQGTVPVDRPATPLSCYFSHPNLHHMETESAKADPHGQKEALVASDVFDVIVLLEAYGLR